MEVGLFLNYLHDEKRYSQNTVLAYGNDLNQFFSYCSEIEQVSELTLVTSKMVRGWEMCLLEDGVKPSSVKRKVSSLKTFFRYLEREGVLKKNPMESVMAPKSGQRLPVFVTEERMDDLLDGRFFGSDFEGVRDRLIMTMFYMAGMRRSELIDLTLRDVDLENGWIKVTGKGNKQRQIPLLSDVVQQIREYLYLRSRLENCVCTNLFLTAEGNSMSAIQVYRLVRAHLSRVTTQTKRSPHVLRHSFATAMLNHGAPIEAIKELLGHSSLAATQVYTHNSFEKLKKVFKQAHPRA